MSIKMVMGDTLVQSGGWNLTKSAYEWYCECVEDEDTGLAFENCISDFLVNGGNKDELVSTIDVETNFSYDTDTIGEFVDCLVFEDDEIPPYYDSPLYEGEGIQDKPFKVTFLDTETDETVEYEIDENTPFKTIEESQYWEKENGEWIKYDPTWIYNFPIRVTIPESMILDDDILLGLVSHVKTLISEGNAAEAEEFLRFWQAAPGVDQVRLKQDETNLMRPEAGHAASARATRHCANGGALMCGRWRRRTATSHSTPVPW